MVYKEKLAELDSRVNFIWVNSLKSIDSDKLMGDIKMIFAKFEGFDSTMLQAGNIEIYMDSSTQIIREVDVEETEIKEVAIDTSIKKHRKLSFTINSETSIDSIQMLPKAFKELEEHKVLEEVAAYMNAMELDLTSLEQALDSNFQAAKLPILYSIRQYNDSLPLNTDFQKERLYKHFNGKSFYLDLNSYGLLPIGKMWFELLMAILLLGVLSTAFYYILNSLYRQNQLIQIKNDLISNITHELRTPIFTVSVALEALENFNAIDNPERTKEYLNISKAELNRLSLLVDKVLKTSMFEEKIAALQVERVNLRALIHNIQDSLKLMLEKFDAELIVEASKNEYWIDADKIHLTNVIYNLIDNALKYNDKKPKILIELSEEGKTLILKVSDNGIGIEPKYKDKLFERFFRVPTGNQHNVKGYGLGLNYVAGVIKKHGGTIKVHSKVGEGTSFEIILPT